MASTLESALQRALSVRLNLQISLSQLPIIEEWMDIHLDRWLEHNPTPPDMPDGEGVTFLAMLGSDLRRVWWGAWGDPRGFVPRMADYFKLCNIAKSDAHLLDQIGEQLEPKLVGSWIGVWGGKVTTGWHFWDPHPWAKVEAMFGTHEAKFAIKKWVDDHHVAADRAVHAIDRRVAVLRDRVRDSGRDRRRAGRGAVGGVRSVHRRAARSRDHRSVPRRGGAAVRAVAADPRRPHRARRCARAGHRARRRSSTCAATRRSASIRSSTSWSRALGEGIVRVEYGRAGERAGVDVYLEPSEPAAKHPTPPPRPKRISAARSTTCSRATTS